MGLFCASCKTRWKGETAFPGKVTKCPKCGHQLTAVTAGPRRTNHVPGATAPGIPAGQLVPPRAAAAAPPQPAAHSGPRVGLIAGTGVGVLALLLLLVVAVLAANNGNTSTDPAVAQNGELPSVDVLPPSSAAKDHPAPAPGTPDTNPGRPGGQTENPARPASEPAEGSGPSQPGQSAPAPGEPQGSSGQVVPGTGTPTPPGQVSGGGNEPRPPAVVGPGVPLEKPGQPVFVPQQPNPGSSSGVVKGKDDGRLGALFDVEFMGSKAKGQRICIIADVSGSMSAPFVYLNPATKQFFNGRKSIDYLRDELVKTLKSLPAEAQFNIILFDSKIEVMPGGTWLSGNQAGQILPWVNAIKPRGGTKPLPAFQYAFSLQPRPDVIFFMTDGIFANSTASIALLNSQQPKVVINAIQLTANPFGAQGLKLLALQSQPPTAAIKLQIQQLQPTVQKYLQQEKAQQLQMMQIVFQNGGNYRMVDPSNVAP